MWTHRLSMLILSSALLVIGPLPSLAIGEKEVDDAPATIAEPAPVAQIINDEGGPVFITGELSYSNAFFTSGVDEPLIILEDQTGFIDRNEYYIFPLESQVLGQITSDFYTSPFSYSLSLPKVPSGALRDVDNNGNEDAGVMVFAIAHWTNLFGDRFLEERDLHGGGWSTGYASTRASDEVETRLEIIGGKFIIYAPDENQGFPSGFGADGLLFTEDDPIVIVPKGYSVVDMDEEPFVFDRAARQIIDLYEPERAAINDFSDLGYAEAFQAMVELFRVEYAYTEIYDLDWDALFDTYSPRFVEAEAAEDSAAYALAMRDFIWEIPDGHVGMPLDAISDLFREETDGGLGIALSELDDGRIVVSYILDGSPAANAGMELGAEILAWDGGAVEEALEREFVWAHQALSTDHTLRLQQLRYITRFPLGSEVEATFRNPESEEEQTATMKVISERASFSHSSFFAGIEGWELPVEFEILPSGYGYVAIYSFGDNERLTVQLWERMIETFLEADVPGIIIDMRKNGGGSGYLADQLGAYFFQEEHILGYSSAYNKSKDDFYLDPRSEDRFILPPEDLRYDGEVAVIIAPGCFSACEFFTYNLTIDDRAAVVGNYGTGGLGGAVDDFLMPEDMTIRFTVTRQFNADKEIHIEAQGVAPTVLVPVTFESLFETGDVLLQAAEAYLTDEILGELIDGGELSLGAGSTEVQANGAVGPDQRVRYRATLPGNRIVSIFLSGLDDTVDTVLGIYNESGSNLLGENDDADDDTRSSALTDLDVGEQAASFTLEVRVKNTNEVQQFTLKIVEVPQEEEDAEESDDAENSADG
ncbi:MAG: S41 family peptidase [Chloroflexi bacterium]|nr:S41 family peptidase [Chloroflexota bacterium]